MPILIPWWRSWRKTADSSNVRWKSNRWCSLSTTSPRSRTRLPTASDEKAGGCALAADGIEAIRLNSALHPDLIVLDVMLPGMDGIQVCRSIRAKSDVPVLFLSARGRRCRSNSRSRDRRRRLSDQAVCHARAGCTRAREPASRSRAPASASSPPAPSVRYPIRRRDDGSAALVRSRSIQPPIPCGSMGRSLHSSRKSSTCCSISWSDPNVTLSREALLRHVWKYEHSVDTRTVDVHVRGLRQKIESDPSNPVLLETVRGYGYRLSTPGD